MTITCKAPNIQRRTLLTLGEKTLARGHMRPRLEVAGKPWKVAELSGRANTSSVISCPVPPHPLGRPRRPGVLVCSTRRRNCLRAPVHNRWATDSRACGSSHVDAEVTRLCVSTLLKPSCTNSPETSHGKAVISLLGTHCYPPVARGKHLRCGACAFLASGGVLAFLLASAPGELPARRSRTKWCPRFRSLRSSR